MGPASAAEQSPRFSRTPPDGLAERAASFVVGGSLGPLVAAFVLLLALTAQQFQLMIGLPAVLIVWFVYVRPFMRSRYRRRVGELQRSWTLRAESEA